MCYSLLVRALVVFALLRVIFCLFVVCFGVLYSTRDCGKFVLGIKAFCGPYRF